MEIQTVWARQVNRGLSYIDEAAKEAGMCLLAKRVPFFLVITHTLWNLNADLVPWLP